MDVQTAPRRAMKCGKRIWVRLTRTEYHMLAFDEQPISHDVEDSGKYLVSGDVIFAEPQYDLIQVAVGSHVLRLPWSRVVR